MAAQRAAISGPKGAATQKRLGIGVHGRSAEQMTADGRAGGLSTLQRGMGIFGRSEEEISDHGKKVGQLTFERGVGIHGKSSSERKQYALVASEARSKLKVNFGEQYYDSYAEAAVATLLEKYIQGFTISRGETYQVSAGLNIKVDFMINNVMVEYNPVVLSHSHTCGGFEKRDEYDSFKETLASLEGDERRTYIEQVRRVLKDRYYIKRRRVLDENPEYMDRELIVATTPAELYDTVLQRFATGIPARNDFVGEFGKTLNVVKEANSSRKSAA